MKAFTAGQSRRLTSGGEAVSSNLNSLEAGLESNIA
jgi:hypothetical protein